MKRCRCCRSEWPLEFFPERVDRGVTSRRGRCLACRLHCRAGSRAARARTYRANLRAQVEAVRLARARVPWDNSPVGISDASPDIMCDALLVADTSREGVPRLEVSAP